MVEVQKKQKTKPFYFALKDSLNIIKVSAPTALEAHKMLFDKYNQVGANTRKIGLVNFMTHKIRTCVHLCRTTPLVDEVALKDCTKSTFKNTVYDKYKHLF